MNKSTKKSSGKKKQAKKYPTKPSRPKALVVVAHPDDETIFFAGAVQSLPYDFDILCMTDGNADGLGEKRRQEFAAACQKLGAKKAVCLAFQDKYENTLDLQDLNNALAEWNASSGPYSAVFTHSPIGEYGHKHHQDISMATHQFFLPKTKVFAVAYNCLPDLEVILSAKHYKVKTDILSQIYFGETQRLIHFLPATSYEGFARLSREEVSAVYSLLREISADTSAVKKYEWLTQYFKLGHYNLKARVF